MLGLKDVVCGALLAWNERIDVFLDNGKTLAALELAKQVYLGVAPVLVGLPADAYARAEQTSSRVVQLLQRFIRNEMRSIGAIANRASTVKTTTVFSNDAAAPSEQRAQLPHDAAAISEEQKRGVLLQLAHVCVACCIDISRTYDLLEDCWTEFQRHGFGGLFLEQLET